MLFKFTEYLSLQDPDAMRGQCDNIVQQKLQDIRQARGECAQPVSDFRGVDTDALAKIMKAEEVIVRFIAEHDLIRQHRSFDEYQRVEGDMDCKSIELEAQLTEAYQQAGIEDAAAQAKSFYSIVSHHDIVTAAQRGADDASRKENAEYLHREVNKKRWQTTGLINGSNQDSIAAAEEQLIWAEAHCLARGETYQETVDEFYSRNDDIYNETPDMIECADADPDRTVEEAAELEANAKLEFGYSEQEHLWEIHRRDAESFSWKIDELKEVCVEAGFDEHRATEHAEAFSQLVHHIAYEKARPELAEQRRVS